MPDPQTFTVREWNGATYLADEAWPSRVLMAHELLRAAAGSPWLHVGREGVVVTLANARAQYRMIGQADDCAATLFELVDGTVDPKPQQQELF